MKTFPLNFGRWLWTSLVCGGEGWHSHFQSDFKIWTRCLPLLLMFATCWWNTLKCIWRPRCPVAMWPKLADCLSSSRFHAISSLWWAYGLWCVCTLVLHNAGLIFGMRFAIWKRVGQHVEEYNKNLGLCGHNACYFPWVSMCHPRFLWLFT